MKGHLKNPRICLISHNSYGLLANRFDKHIGGVEIQTALVSKWLAHHGYDVSVIVWNEGGDKLEVIDGVKIIKLCRVDAGLPFIRFFYPRWFSLISALRKADADIYYHNCAEYVTGQVALWCKFNKKHFVYSVASEPECNSKLPDLNTNRDRIFYRIGIKLAQLIFVQNEKQKNMLMDGFGLAGKVLNMPCDGPQDINYKHKYYEKKPDQIKILWVGRFSPVKRPELLLDLADRFNNIEFYMVGGMDQDVDYAADIVKRARSRDNVFVVGKVDRDKLSYYYVDNYLLCSTSLFEGLPNVFLEAWSFGLPIVSTFDPNDMISRNSLGWYCEDMNVMADVIDKLILNHESWQKQSLSCRKYYLQNHSVDESMKYFTKEISDLLNKK